MRFLRLFLLPALGALAATALGSGNANPPFAQPRITLARPLPGEPGHADNATSILPGGEGAVIGGWTAAGGVESALLVRVNATGDIIWRRTFGDRGESIIWAVVPDADGFVAAGHTDRLGAGSRDGWVIRVNGKGELIWEKTFGGAGDDRFYSLASVDGGYLCVGQTSSSGAGKSDAWVVKVDLSGDQVASWTWGTPDVERAFAIQAAPDGCIIAGMSGPGEKEASPFVACLDSRGTEAWRVLEKSPGFGVAHGIAALPEGRFLITGYAMSDGPNGADGFAFVVDGEGKVRSRGTFGGAGNDRALHAATFADGSSVVVGYSQPAGERDGASGWDLVLYALAPDYVNTWTGRFGGTGPEMGRNIAGRAQDLWVIGQTGSGHDSGSSLYLIRLDVSTLGGPPAK